MIMGMETARELLTCKAKQSSKLMSLTKNVKKHGFSTNLTEITKKTKFVCGLAMIILTT